MNRGSSPLQAKAKRRQSDAKWRASVATCYDALKYVVPNVKNMAKRKISKALILQESERHIKELETTIIQLLETESKKRGKTVLWKEGPNWTQCTLEKLRMDFSEKQQRVFHMAAHGRRCYNLLQDIKEEVFAMEADSSRLVVLPEKVVAASSTKANVKNKLKEGPARGVQPAQKINLVLSGPSLTSKQQRKMAVFKMKASSFEADATITTAEEVLSITSSLFSKPLSGSVMTLSTDQTSLPACTKAAKIMPNFLTLPYQICGTVSATNKGKSTNRNTICSKNCKNSPECQTKSSKSISTLGLSNKYNNPPSSCSHHNGQRDSNLHNKLEHYAAGASKEKDNETRKLKIHIENVKGDFYIISEPNSSTIHLVKATSPAAENNSVIHPTQTSFSEMGNEQEVPSMKLPLKLPKGLGQEDVHCQRNSQGPKAGVREVPKDIRPETLSSYTSAEVNDRDYGDSIKHDSCETVPENKEGMFTVIVSCPSAQTHTPNQESKNFLAASDVKIETPINYTPQNHQDPLLSSLVTPKPDDSTPLFMRAENDMVIKRPPRLGTARKKLNFGFTPDKHESSSLGKMHSSVEGFIPVRLPDEFCMLPDGDETSFSSLASPWKIVDNPFLENRMSSQDYMDSTTMLDLHDNLMCMETMDTMDLDDGSVDHHDLGSPDSPVPGVRAPLKCRRKLDNFYDEARSNWEEYQLDSGTITVSDLNDCQSVPDIDSSIKREVCCESERTDKADHARDNASDEARGTCPDSDMLKAEITFIEEEIHVVPDFDESHKNNNQNVAKAEPSSPIHSVFYSNNDCDDFDGYYYYYRLISQQLKQDSKSSTSGFSGIRSEIEGGSTYKQSTATLTPAHHSSSSDTVAAKVAHMWSRLPVQDKITMATLANLEQKQGQDGKNSSLQRYHTNAKNQRYTVQNHSVSSGSRFDTFKKCEDVLQSNSLDNPHLNLLDKDGNHNNFLGLEEPSLNFSEQESPQDKVSSFYNRQSGFLNTFLSPGLNQSCMAAMDDLEDFESVQENFQSCQGNSEKPRNEQVFKNSMKTFLLPPSEEPLVLGELSPDLQDVEVQPLIDHTYGNSFDVN
ncbi:hypothetical protein PoB_003243800 [Plakobranchus ocellatus]|uniref:BHLH domain-containing protein n=1 Tax=Plakobranchus ocellatus TaxID=259542 RepID=A0AAV4AF76_9GAST|nr:hypothetical protein PoB_003243800 [Plakobranchus ocellatus]